MFEHVDWAVVFALSCLAILFWFVGYHMGEKDGGKMYNMGYREGYTDCRKTRIDLSISLPKQEEEQ